MAKFVTEVEAIQVQDNLSAVKKFIGEKDLEVKEDGSFSFKSSEITWNVLQGDYIVKGPLGSLVYKPERFEKEFTPIKK